MKQRKMSGQLETTVTPGSVYVIGYCVSNDGSTVIVNPTSIDGLRVSNYSSSLHILTSTVEEMSTPVVQGESYSLFAGWLTDAALETVLADVELRYAV